MLSGETTFVTRGLASTWVSKKWGFSSESRHVCDSCLAKETFRLCLSWHFWSCVSATASKRTWQLTNEETPLQTGIVCSHSYDAGMPHSWCRNFCSEAALLNQLDTVSRAYICSKDNANTCKHQILLVWSRIPILETCRESGSFLAMSLVILWNFMKGRSRPTKGSNKPSTTFGFLPVAFHLRMACG